MGRGGMDRACATISLGFGISAGFALILVACAVPGNWWPLFALSPYFLAPIPIAFTSSFNSDAKWGSEEVNVWEQFGMCTGTFLGTGLFALPLIMAHVAVIESLALWLTLAGQLVTLASVAYFSQFLKSDESDRLL